MAKRILNRLTRMPGVKAAMLLLGFACLLAGETATFQRATRGWMFLHPFFKDRNWGITRERLYDSIPGSLAALNPLRVDFSHGKENVMALLSVAGGDLYDATVLYQKLTDPGYDAYLEFGDPKKITLGGLSLPPTGGFYVVKDSLYSFDSLRVAVPAQGLKLYIATIQTSSNTVIKLDSVSFSQKQTGQSITDVFGDPDSLTRQDRGVWVTGTRGLVRYIPYANGQWGAEAVRDLSDNAETPLFASSAFVSTVSGKIFKWQNTTFVQAAATSPAKPVWRVYPKGAIGAGGLFKELGNGVWKKDTAFGSASYRHANFILRSGGFGVELLDSAWTLKACTYRDTTSRIVRTQPPSLMDYINKTSYVYHKGSLPLDVWIELEDLDSNYRDYTLNLTSSGGPVNCKSDGKFSIEAIPDSEYCHIGTLKMKNGNIRLKIDPATITIEHDCVLGAWNSIAGQCYWKAYTFSCPRNWLPGSTITLATAIQQVSIMYDSQVTAAGYPGPETFLARYIARGFTLQLPLSRGAYPVSITVYDLSGRLIAMAPVRNGQRLLTLPAVPKAGLVIVSCAMSDGSVISRKVPVVK